MRSAARASLASLALLTACASEGVPERPTPPPVTPTAAGLEVTGTGLEIGFGRTQDSTVAALARLGASAPIDLPCGTDIALEYSGGLRLTFQNQTFVGWQQGDGSAGTICIVDFST